MGQPFARARVDDDRRRRRVQRVLDTVRRCESGDGCAREVCHCRDAWREAVHFIEGIGVRSDAGQSCRHRRIGQCEAKPGHRTCVRHGPVVVGIGKAAVARGQGIASEREHSARATRPRRAVAVRAAADDEKKRKCHARKTRERSIHAADARWRGKPCLQPFGRVLNSVRDASKNRE